jgi:hypothetical protein
MRRLIVLAEEPSLYKRVSAETEKLCLAFDVSTDNVGLHLKNSFEDGELSREPTTEKSSSVQIEGNVPVI